MANERGRLTDTLNTTQVLLNNSGAGGTNASLAEEECFIQLRLSQMSIPLTSSSLAGREITGRFRTVTVQGIKWGTQVELEAFIKILDDWANSNGFVQNWRYYPLVHKNNTAGEGLQNQYYGVIPESFVFRMSLQSVGYILEYTLVMLEGVGVTTFTSAL